MKQPPLICAVRDTREFLLEMLARDAFKYRAEPFQLKSGGYSNLYVNCRPVALSAEGGRLLGYALSDVILREDSPLAIDGADVTVYGGVVLGSVPLADQAAFRTWNVKRAYVRPEPKSHGTATQVELPSDISEGSENVVFFEDVTTTGGSVCRAVAAYHAERPQDRILGVVAVVNRCRDTKTMISNLRRAAENDELAYAAIYMLADVYKKACALGLVPESVQKGGAK